MLPALAGANMIYGVGMLENGITWDFAQLVMQCEFIKMILKTCEGIPVDDEHLACDVIAEVGPGGEFVSHMHTFQNFKHLSAPNLKIIDRYNYDGWVAGGSKDVVERSYEIAIDKLETGKPANPLPENIAKGLKDIISDSQATYAAQRAKK